MSISVARQAVALMTRPEMHDIISSAHVRPLLIWGCQAPRSVAVKALEGCGDFSKWVNKFFDDVAEKPRGRKNCLKWQSKCFRPAISALVTNVSIATDGSVGKIMLRPTIFS
jgi:hypothetical protein